MSTSQNNDSTSDNKLFYCDEVSDLVAKHDRTFKKATSEAIDAIKGECASEKAAGPVGAPADSIFEISPRPRFTRSDDWTTWELLCKFADIMGRPGWYKEKLVRSLLPKNQVGNRKASKRQHHHNNENSESAMTKGVNIFLRPNRTNPKWSRSSSSSTQHFGTKQCAKSRKTSDRGVAMSINREEYYRSDANRTREQSSVNALPGPLPRSQSRPSRTAHYRHSLLRSSPPSANGCLVIRRSGCPKGSTPFEESILTPSDLNAIIRTADSRTHSRSSNRDQLPFYLTGDHPSKSLFSHSCTQQHSLHTKSQSKSLSRRAHKSPNVQRRECATKVVPFDCNASLVQRTQQLEDLFRVECLKKELAKVTIGSEYHRNSHDHSVEQSKLAKIKSSRRRVNSRQRRAERELLEHSSDSDSDRPSLGIRLSHQHHHCSPLEYSHLRSRLLPVYTSTCSGDDDDDVMHERPSGTNRFSINATNDGDSRKTHMVSLTDSWSASPLVSAYNSSLSSISSSLTSSDFASLPFQRMHRWFDRVRPIDQATKSIDYSGIGGTMDRHLHQIPSAASGSRSYCAEGDRFVHGYRMDGSDFKVDEGFLVKASSRGRLNNGMREEGELVGKHRPLRRIKINPAKEKSFSRSCDLLNMPSQRRNPDSSPSAMHECETESFNRVNDYCPHISEFKPSSWTPRPPRSRGPSAVERRLKRGTSSVVNCSPYSGGYGSMLNLVISENNGG
ncbi:unnamed protein product [Toxocara canis]|uniref:Protein kinase domain-containing protein n=1 Tax=Toxocara canis TaxID=6265 RepID=A0A183UWA8_TOXCA|nr:unnamed protein product [Toxocara canis]